MLGSYMKEKQENKIEAVVVLDNIRSTHNVGAIFRTADAVGVSKIYLTGITPAPKDRFGRDRSDIAKTALGAEKIIPWEQCVRMGSLLTRLKNQGFTVVAVEQAKNSIDYKTFKPKGKIAFIFGNEVKGVAPAVLKKCDAVLEIPMKGKKESLNISVSAGIVLFCILDK